MNSIIEKIKQQWDKYKVQMIGAVLLVIAFVLAVLNKAVEAWIVLVSVGILDLCLIYIWKDITISRWIRGLTGSKVDTVIMLGLVALCWWLKGEAIALWFLLGLLNNHLFEKD